MNKVLIVPAFVIFCFYPYLARADTSQLAVSQSNLPVASQPAVSVPNTPVPDISGWTVTNISRIELRISDDTVAYIGLEIEYNNPADPREFVWVTHRHISLIISKQDQPNERLLSEMVVVFYTQKEEQDRLKEVSDKSDPILYIQWRTKESPRTKNDMQDGDFKVWFLSPNGDWTFVRNQEVETEFMTENIGNGKPRNVFSGMKYGVDGFSHIIRVDRNDLINLFEGGK